MTGNPVIFILGLLTAGIAAAVPDDTLFTAVLQQHVDEGRVDYGALAEDERLDIFLGQVAATAPSDLSSREARLAFWINAYNAYTLKLITSVYPVESIRQIKALGETGSRLAARPWDQPFAVVGGHAYTLNQIENEIIRPEFKDPRIHFGLVCAAVSCPRLRPEAYVPDRLATQLEEEGLWFVAHRSQFDARRRQAQLSAIFDWYRVDFGNGGTDLLKFLADYVSDPATAHSLRTEPHRWKISYLDYDWSLNRQL